MARKNSKKAMDINDISYEYDIGATRCNMKSIA